ncbi:MAG: zf-HC2 domain-containing protein [Planctomycetota bacterium]
MLSKIDNHDCEHILELASAGIDGELTSGEAEQLRRHLDVCDSCYEFAARLNDVNELVVASVEESASVASMPVVSLVDRSRMVAPVQPRVPVIWRLLTFVAAAVVLIAAFIFFPRSSDNSAIADVEAEEFARPFAELQMLNEERARSHDLSIQLLALNVRRLWCELDRLERQEAEGASLDPEAAARRNELIRKLESITRELQKINLENSGDLDFVE